MYYDGATYFGARGRRLVRSQDGGHTWESFGCIELPFPLRLATSVRALHRLARTEIYKMHRIGDHLVALARGGVYTGSVIQGRLRLSCAVSHGSRPVSLACGPGGEVLFGDYHSNPHRRPVRIHRSSDFEHWQVAHEFAAGDIRHIHGIYDDPYEDCYWVLAGDYHHEPGIIRCERDFSDVRFVRRGSQEVRAYSLLVHSDGLLYATDSENGPNHIYHLDRATRRLTALHRMENASYHSGRFGAWMLFSTACEPSRVNDTRNVHLWCSRDKQGWREVAHYRKDALPFVFQYGTLFFPEGQTEKLNEFAYSGTALRGMDDVSVFAPLAQLEEGGAP